MQKIHSNSANNARKWSAQGRREIQNISMSAELKAQSSTQTPFMVSQNNSLILYDSTKSTSRIRTKSAKPPAGIANPFNNQTNSCWNSRKSVDAMNVKWIGVHHSPYKESSMAHRQAFPTRKQRTADQSFANFVLKYGRRFKAPKESKNPVVLNDLNDKMISNAATNKVKPRLTWYDRKKLGNREKGAKKMSCNL